MASGTALSTAKGGRIHIGSDIRDSLSLLDVLYANQFEGEFIDPKVVEQTEENFYRGAPPTWLNFHISDQADSDGTGTSLIKRDGYDSLVQQIRQRRRRPGTSTVKLFHQPGCGGTTLAMQVLWDLGTTFRSAVLTGSASDIKKVAREVVYLFTAGSEGLQNTVLLLLNDEQSLETLQDSILMEIDEQKIVTHMPVAILLSCVRKDEVFQNDSVILKAALSDTEKLKFDDKKKELHKKYSNNCDEFHGFNIMQTNFSQDYVKQACKVFSTVQRANRPLKTQLAGFLSLLNAYVPGSYLLESQCLDLFKHKDYNFEDRTLEDRMEPFTHLIIAFQQDTRSEKKVRMVHPMIAQCCTEIMAEAGVTRSDTARNFLACLCRDEVPPFLLGFVKDMLTKRETKMKKNPVNSTEIEEDQELFSRLILDIQGRENKKQSASVLKVASKKFDENPFFPQALARFYYIELHDYNQAEIWAKTAKQRDLTNSFIADTLGQVHKNHLKSKECHPKDRYLKKEPARPREILQLASKAIEAFKDEEQLAENEHAADVKGDGKTKVSHVFNSRGQFGYLQVCNLVYDLLVSQNNSWRGVLTKNVSMCSVLNELGDNKLFRFNELINSLRDEVERKCAFFEKYLTYSQPDMRKGDPKYISRDTSDCYRKYVGDSPPKHVKEKCADAIQKLKQRLADTSAGVLSCLDKEYTESELKEITTWWEEIDHCKDSVTALGNYILSHIMLINMGALFPYDLKSLTALKQKMPLSPNNASEFHMLALLLYWPTDGKDECGFDLRELLHNMNLSYENEYKTYFRSRYLRPQFFIGKGEGLNRIVHRRVLEGLFEKHQDTTQGWTDNWSNEKIFEDPMVQQRLLKVDGVVRNYKVYAIVGGKGIQVDANLRNSLWKPRQVTFYLGFTIRGPVAFGIQTKFAENATDTSKPGQIKAELLPYTDPIGGPSELMFGACCSKIDSSDWTKLEPTVNRVDGVHTYRLESVAGHFECSVSALRWVCKEKVSIKYQFCSWDEHREKPSCLDYIPAGPLLNITVMAGKIEEIHLPHWIDVSSTTADMFAVLHVDTCGDFVEKVSEVTVSHVKLCQPTFSPRGVMFRVKLGFPVKIYYEALIYKTKKEFLTLHVYLVPPDHDVQERVERNETSHGSIIISKPSPDKSLQMLDQFFLTADTDTAEITPSTLKLTCERRRPNFFEVFIRNADTDFTLRLESEQKKNSRKDTVWTCPIRKGDYRNQITDHEQAAGQHFVDRHRTALINRVSDTGFILDKLLDRGLISSENYDAVRALKTSEDQMRDIHKYVTKAGIRGKDALYEILKGMKSMRPLISDLEESG